MDLNRVVYYHTIGGVFDLNGEVIPNETVVYYVATHTERWGAFPLNSSYVFLNFTYTQGSYATNPYSHLVNNSTNVWLYFGDAGAPGPPGAPEFNATYYLLGAVTLCPFILLGVRRWKRKNERGV